MEKVYPIQFALQGTLDIKADSIQEAYQIAYEIIKQRKDRIYYARELETQVWEDTVEEDAMDVSDWREADLDKLEGGE